MTSILMWSGIALILIGRLSIAGLAYKRLAAKDELEKFPQKQQAILLRRRYCRLMVFLGIALLLVSLIV